jgi:MFS family permease
MLARNRYHAAPLLSTIPYVLFAAVMVAGRLVGDRLAAAFSTRSIRMVSGSCIAVGLGVGMVMNTLSGEILAWVLFGIGSSNVIPLLFSVAGRAALSREGSTLRPCGAIALVTAIAYSGSLVGPPAIGYLADIFALYWALILPAVLGGVMAIGVPLVLRRGDDVVANPAEESA